MSMYTEKLDELVQIAKYNSGTSGRRALESVLRDLDGDGPVGELLHILETEVFVKVMSLFFEFRRTGQNEPFNSIHERARSALDR